MPYTTNAIRKHSITHGRTLCAPLELAIEFCNFFQWRQVWRLVHDLLRRADENMSIAEVEDRTVAVVTLLRNGGRGAAAHDMARLAADLKNPQKAEGALEGIIARCGIRWLGDLPLRNIGSTEWLQKLSTLESAARAELVLTRDRSSQHRRSALKIKRPNTSRGSKPGKEKNTLG